nr:unnamed protein product [Callosobruchus chinensis]
MAENAANFTATLQAKPSIFEIIAQKSLSDTLQPAFRKLAEVLATNFPKKFAWLNNYCEESFAVLNWLLQYNYLRNYDASFSENFYGLKRVCADGKHLSNHHRELSLLFLVLVPYFKRKFDEKVTLYMLEEADGYLNHDFESKLKKVAVHSHSAIELTWSLLSIYNYLKYMTNQTEFQTPLYRVVNVKLVYDTQSPDITNFWSTLFKGELSKVQFNFTLFKSAIATTLEIGAFFLQFLQTWSAQKSNYSITNLPKVPPPPLDVSAEKYSGRCPLCLKPWSTPTALQVSGYIFCFRCILRYLNEHHKCPVTNLPAKQLDIVRLYT